MKILIACEFSGIVRAAFASRGHEVWSADLLPTEKAGNHLLIKDDGHLKAVVYTGGWDMLIAHPPCTRLTNSVIGYIRHNRLEHEVKPAADFFNMLLDAPIKKKCLENPIQNPEARRYIRRQDQVIQPYRFGENASKATCLWLVGLPLLKATQFIPPVLINGKRRWANQSPSGDNRYGPSPDRCKLRSRTFEGIAEAMADQWG